MQIRTRVVLELFCLIAITCALPVDKKVKTETSTVASAAANIDDEISQLEYSRYLLEVVNLLESDPEFKKKLENATDHEIKTGKLAKHLEFVNHQVRTQLDEAKRRELDRLRELANKEFELRNEVDRDHLKIADHIEVHNTKGFEIKDLEKLIMKTTRDLDKKRETEYKFYELEKEYQRQKKLKRLPEAERKKSEADYQASKKGHLKGEKKMHHPGNKPQLEEVWTEQDGMDQKFDPRLFFALHDLDANNQWDEGEVKALFVKQVKKEYLAGSDPIEQAEELERMREHYYKEVDLNQDGLISLDEFMQLAKKDEFRKDPGWEPISEQQVFTDQEFLEYARRREMEDAQEDLQQQQNGQQQHGPPVGQPVVLNDNQLYEAAQHVPQQQQPNTAYQQQINQQQQQQQYQINNQIPAAAYTPQHAPIQQQQQQYQNIPIQQQQQQPNVQQYQQYQMNNQVPPAAYPQQQQAPIQQQQQQQPIPQQQQPIAQQQQQPIPQQQQQPIPQQQQQQQYQINNQIPAAAYPPQQTPIQQQQQQQQQQQPVPPVAAGEQQRVNAPPAHSASLPLQQPANEPTVQRATF